MGIIIKETIKSSVISYIGVLIGFVNVGYLYDEILTKGEIGYIGITIAVSEIFSSIFSFGIPSMISKYFPWFYVNNKHKGVKLIITSIFFISSVIIIPFLMIYLHYFSGDFKLFLETDFTFKIVFLWILSSLIFKLYDSLYKMLFKISLSVFLKDILQRLFVTISLIAVYYNIINFKEFLMVNLLGVSVSGIVIMLKIILNKKFDWSFYIPKEHKKGIINISLISLIGSLGGVIIVNIDKIMVNGYTTIEKTGIYTIMLYYATIIVIPSRSLKKISIPVIAESWKNKNIENINNIYKASSRNLFFVGSLILGLLIINTDIILKILDKSYESAIIIPSIIGIGYLFDLLTGVNNEIISTSKEYKWSLYFTLISAFIAIILNILLIPNLGMIGAALGSMITFVIVNTLRFLFVYYKFNMNPFSLKTIQMILLLGVPLATLIILPKLENLYLDNILKSLILILLYFLINRFFSISNEIKNIINQFIIKLKKNN